jgi:hypothetical protein
MYSRILQRWLNDFFNFPMQATDDMHQATNLETIPDCGSQVIKKYASNYSAQDSR